MVGQYKDFPYKESWEFSYGEKIKAFDLLHASAVQALKDHIDGELDDDTPHYMFEAVMELLKVPGQDFWARYNAVN